jgi:hypothetical protein
MGCRCFPAGLNFEEFVAGMKRILKNVHISRDDFDIVSENGKHLGSSGEFDSEQFRDMMKGEVRASPCTPVPAFGRRCIDIDPWTD